MHRSGPHTAMGNREAAGVLVGILPEQGMEGVYYYVGGTMTDETGGKPLMGRITFGRGHPSQAAMDRMQEAGWRLLCERGELATGPATPSVTIPTAALTELLAAAEECAGDLATALDHEYADRDTYPSYYRKYERDMAPVRRLRAAVARVRGEAPMTMREKMARAMHAADLGGEWPVNDPAMMDAYLGHADAALSALAEPTEAMLRAVEFGDAEGIWNAMICAAGEG